MKNLILILFIVLVSCSGSDDNNTVNIDENLVGKWSLIQYGKWPQGNFYYENNDIIWEFYQDGTLTVTVNESVELHPELPLQTSGVFTWTTFLSGQSNEYNNLAISSFPDTLGYKFQISFDLIMNHEDPTDGNSYWMCFDKID